MTARQRQRVSSPWTPADPAEATWQEFALCAETDPDAFFPGKGESVTPAKKVCMRCEVRAECLEYALDNEISHGVWGGLSEQQRRKIRSERKQVAA